MQLRRRVVVSHWPGNAPLVRAAGDVTRARIEPASRPERIDHVWLTLDCGIGTPVEVSVNTRSRRNAEAGFDSRVRLGRLRGEWTTLPPRGVEQLECFDYADLESAANIYYETCDPSFVEGEILSAARTCLRLEVIGEPYHRRVPGIHQIHSRRASCGVTDDVTGRDGALRFFFERDRETVWWFLKFCGQP